ncbi:MAG: hypothetical protein M3464_16565 [Chloroflexota bacterium]|nr:hypothetical protein [Chloroflexota bacterium]
MKTLSSANREIDLAIAVYLNQDVMLDLLASIDDGFAMFSQVTADSADTSAKAAGASTELGTANFLSSVLKIDFGASGKAEIAETSSSSTTLTRYYTVGSLFHKLRESMQATSVVRYVDGASPEAWGSLRPSDFVEFRGVISPNPFAHTLRTILDSVDVLRAFQTPPAATHSSKTSRPSGGQNRPAKGSSTTSDGFEWVDPLRTLLSDVEKDDERVIIVRPSVVSEYTVVATIDLQLLRTISLPELFDGEYRILGQVTRHLGPETSESINLLRKSTLQAVVGRHLRQAIDDMAASSSSADLTVQVGEQAISAPAVQVIPIAIYP